MENVENSLYHYGTPRHSGRYPWGSGKDAYQSARSFLGMVDEFRKQGLSEIQIVQGFGLKSTSELRAYKSLAKDEFRAEQRATVIRLKEKGMSNVAIGSRMGINESSVRSLLNPVLAERASITKTTVNALKTNVDQFRYIDVGSGAENHMGISRTRLKTAIAELKAQGYKIHQVKVAQVGIPGQFTTVHVLGAPDTTYKEVFDNHYLIQPVTGRSEDFGRTFSDLGLRPIESVDSKRVMVRYKEEGGSDKDGLIELRRGVKDLDLGNATYAQVRIGVDDSHYMKGMAVYNDDMPKGVDIIYNSNKPIGTPMMGTKDNTVMKNMKADPANPFGSTIKSIVDTESGERIAVQRGALNIVNEEGDWNNWSKTISSQVLSKQTTTLAKQQLDLAYQYQKDEFDDIMKLTNPVVKQHLLNKFADGADAETVHLRAAALPRQANKVLLPVPSIRPNEIYAPSYKDGEVVVLIRHPHGGTFEIPELVVNNSSKEARAIMPNARDAIGIHPDAAKKLSGADFDGDTAIVIPNPYGAIKTRPAVASLQNFDPIESYKIPEGSLVKKITPQYKQNQMGVVSNLITDMTIRGAELDEITKAVRHSMVVIDSEKHGLDYRQSAKDNGIQALRMKYQGKGDGKAGASTIISQGSSEIKVPERTEGAYIGRVSKRSGEPVKDYVDPKTGEKLYTETGATYVQRTISDGVKTQHGLPKNASYKQTVAKLKEDGMSEADIAMVTREKTVKRLSTTTKMEQAPDAFALSSGTPMEGLYATHANSLKALANEARKVAINLEPTPYSPAARTAYAKEVASLNTSLAQAQMNKPREREAQIIAGAIVGSRIDSNPGMDKDEVKKIRTQALTEARNRAGAKKDPIEISPKEWEAIQAGAVTTNILTQILNNTDLAVIKQYATPRQEREGLSQAKISRARQMLDSGFTQAEIAERLGVSVSQLVDELYK